MTSYTKTGPFTDGASPGISSAFLNALETAVVNGGSMYFTTPFTQSNNGTLNSGNTVTFTVWGNGGVPSGAIAVLLNAFFSTSAAGTFATFTPHGTAWSNGNYPAVGTSFNATNICMGSSLIVPLDTAGKFDVKANNGNCIGFYIVQYGYIV